VALVVALLVFALCASLLVAMQRDFQLNYRRASNVFIAEQSDAYLRGAEDLAALALRIDYDADQARGRPRDALDEVWAQDAQPYPLDEGGWLLGTLEDLQGRFNLNSLAAPPRDGDGAAAYSPAQQTFIRLLQALEGPGIDRYRAIAITESIADWIDADDDPRLNGTESAFYVSQTPSYAPANQAMASVSELRAVANVTPEIYAALAPYVTVWPRVPATINVHTAPLPVLRALNIDGDLEPLSRSDGEALLARRREFGFEDLQDFLDEPVFAVAETTDISTLLGEASSWFLLTARVEIADRQAGRYSVIRRASRDAEVLARIDASLYDLTPVSGDSAQ
jgi:general secretion pathway protein K